MTNNADQDEYGNLRLDYLMMALHNAVEETVGHYGLPFFSEFSFPPMFFIVDKNLGLHGGPLFGPLEIENGDEIEFPLFNVEEIADCIIDMGKYGWMDEDVEPLPIVLCAVSVVNTFKAEKLSLNSRLFVVLDDDHILSRYEVENDPVVANVNTSLNDVVVSQMYKILNEIKELYYG